MLSLYFWFSNKLHLSLILFAPPQLLMPECYLCCSLKNTSLYCLSYSYIFFFFLSACPLALGEGYKLERTSDAIKSLLLSIKDVMGPHLPLSMRESPLSAYVTTPNAPHFKISMFWDLLAQSPKLFRSIAYAVCLSLFLPLRH